MPGALASLTLALAGCGDRTPAAPAAPAAPARDAVAPVATASSVAVVDTSVPQEPVGDELVAEAVPEPVVENATAPAAVRSIRSAFEKRDVRALARLISGKPTLDTDDLARAEREFFLFEQPRVWERVLPQLESTRLDELDPRAPRVTLHVHVGGDLGDRRYTLERSDRGWFLVRS